MLVSVFILNKVMSDESFEVYLTSVYLVDGRLMPQ